MLPNVLLMRLNRELADLERDPPPGIVCFPVDDDDITHLEAYIKGPPDSPYEEGTFRLEIHVPLDYPFNPPQISFKTMIYHPNIDNAGRICADILKKGENGGWKPSLNLSTTLISLSALMGSPNPDDPLDAEIAQEYRVDNSRFLSKAKELTRKYATGEQAKKDTTMQKQESKPGSSDAEVLGNLERNANRPKQKSKLSLSTKKRKSKSPSIIDSSSTPSSSQMAGEDTDMLEVESSAPSGNAESTVCSDGEPAVLKVKSEAPSSNTDNAAYDNIKPVTLNVSSDAPSISAEHCGHDNFPVEDTETMEMKNSASSECAEDVVCKDKPVEVMDVLEIESSASSSNEDSATCNDIETIPLEETSPAKLPSSRASSLVGHPSSQQPELSKRSSQRPDIQKSASIKNIDAVDSMLTGKENIDDAVGSQKRAQSIEPERYTPLQPAKNVNSKELVKEAKKDKGKAVYKSLVQMQGSCSAGSESISSPSEYMVGCGWRSSFDSFSFGDAIDLTSDNDFIPKKRTTDPTKRSKLSLSKSKRQKSQTNASQS